LNFYVVRKKIALNISNERKPKGEYSFVGGEESKELVG